MSRRTKLIGVIICLVAILSFAARPIWKLLKLNAATATAAERTKALVEKNPQLKPAWDKAMEDDVLTQSEADEILKSGGEKTAP